MKSLTTAEATGLMVILMSYFVILWNVNAWIIGMIGYNIVSVFLAPIFILIVLVVLSNITNPFGGKK